MYTCVVISLNQSVSGFTLTDRLSPTAKPVRIWRMESWTALPICRKCTDNNNGSSLTGCINMGSNN